MQDNQQALQLASEATALQGVIAQYKAFPCNDQPAADFLNQQLIAIKTRGKALAEQEATATKPIQESLKVVKGWFSPLRDACADLERVIKGKLAEFSLAQQRQAAAQLEAASKAFQANQVQQGIALMSSAPEAPTFKGTTIRKRWSFEVQNPWQVERQYCSPDEKLIRQAVASGVRQIAGVRIYEDSVVTTRI